MISTETPSEDGRQQPNAEQTAVPFPDTHGEHSELPAEFRLPTVNG